MTKKLIYKIIALSSVIFLSQSFLASQQPLSPFDKYDPNKKNKNQQKGSPVNQGMLSQESEMQIRDLIFQEFQMRDSQLQRDKDSGIAPLDEHEVLYLGPNESLRGTVEAHYLIYNKTTNMFRYENMDQYKKVVTSEEVTNILEKESLKEQTQGKIKR